MQYLKDMAAKEIAPGFFGKMIHGEKTTLAFFQIKKGSILKEHHHPNEQITHILEGDLEMTIGGEKMIFTAGTAQVIPSGVPHSATALTDCRVIDAFAPPREDYK